MTVEQCLFDIYFIIMLLIKGLGFTDGPIYKAGIVLATGVVAVKILVGRYNAVERAAIILLTALGMLDWYVSRDLGLPICLFLVLAMKGVDKRHAFKVGAVVWSGTFVLQILTQLLNLRARDSVIHPKLGLGHLIRWSLGYSHPNVLQVAYTVLVFYLLYVVRPAEGTHRKSLIDDRRLRIALILSTAGMIYIAFYSLSYTGVLMYLVFVVFLVYNEWNRYCLRRRTIWENVALQAVLPLSVLFSIVVPLIYSIKEFRLLTDTFTSRIKLSSMFPHDYGVTLLGRDFSHLKANYTTDCSYMHLLMHGGLIFLIVFVVLYVALIRGTLHDEPSWENSVEISMLMSCVIAAISEPFAFNTSYKNVTLLLLGGWLYTVTAHLGERRAWMCTLAQMGDRTIALPDLWCMMMNTCRRWLQILRRHLRMAMIATSVIACVSVMVFVVTARWPREVVASASLFNGIDYSNVICYTQEEITALENEPDIWVLNYKGPEDLMFCLETEGSNLVRLEQVRGVFSAALWSAAGTLLVLTTVWDIADRRQCKEQGIS